MRKNIILIGEPKSGKSTLLKKIISDIPNKTGFVTNEILGDEGRVGFEIESSNGDKAILAHVDFNTPNKVSRYFVDISNLESLIPDVSRFNEGELLYIDEIGQMQLFSEKFKDLVLSYLNSSNTCIATLTTVFEDSFVQSVKDREDIILIQLTPSNREEMEEFISQLLKKVSKAQYYVSESERFTTTESGIELKSEHGTRRLKLVEASWNCDCEFFSRYEICSHAIAAEELF